MWWGRNRLALADGVLTLWKCRTRFMEAQVHTLFNRIALLQRRLRPPGAIRLAVGGDEVIEAARLEGVLLEGGAKVARFPLS